MSTLFKISHYNNASLTTTGSVKRRQSPTASSPQSLTGLASASNDKLHLLSHRLSNLLRMLFLKIHPRAAPESLPSLADRNYLPAAKTKASTCRRSPQSMPPSAAYYLSHDCPVTPKTTKRSVPLFKLLLTGSRTMWTTSTTSNLVDAIPKQSRTF